MRPSLLDLFCGAGGAAMGYHRAGFDVVGVDINPQPRYPFQFIQADALEYLKECGHCFDAIHASPPCQAFSAMTRGRWKDRKHPDLVAETRRLLIQTGRPYVIENVEGAPLISPIRLCGTMFGLQSAGGNQLRRHRLFECPFIFDLLTPCAHNEVSAIGVYGGGQHPRRRTRQCPSDRSVPEDADFGIVAKRQAMGIDWMSGNELNQAIPPAYTQWIGERLLEHFNGSN